MMTQRRVETVVLYTTVVEYMETRHETVTVDPASNDSSNYCQLFWPVGLVLRYDDYRAVAMMPLTAINIYGAPPALLAEAMADEIVDGIPVEVNAIIVDEELCAIEYGDYDAHMEVRGW